MAKRIDSLKPGTVVTLRFHGSLGNATHDEQATFLEILGEGDDKRARFETPRSETDGPYDWQAYRYQGRWAYGTGADRLSLVEAK